VNLSPRCVRKSNFRRVFWPKPEAAPEGRLFPEKLIGFLHTVLAAKMMGARGVKP